MKNQTTDKSHQLNTSLNAMAVLASITLVIAAISSIWKFFASQSPSSPLHVGPLIGPIDSLMTACWIAGFGGLALFAALSVFKLSPSKTRQLVYIFCAGWILLLAGFLLGAFLGTNGIQIIKSYPRTLIVLFVKLFGFLCVSTATFLLAASLLKR